MKDAQVVKPKKGEQVETITSFEVKEVPRAKSNRIRLKSRSRTPSGDRSRAGSILAIGFSNAVKRAADSALASLGMRNPPSVKPMSLIPREERKGMNKKIRDPLLLRKTPYGIREVHVDEEGEDEDDRRRRRNKYEDSSEPELNSLNQVEGPKASLNVVWATVDSEWCSNFMPASGDVPRERIEGGEDDRLAIHHGKRCSSQSAWDLPAPCHHG